jgi:hypothetical protein
VQVSCRAFETQLVISGATATLLAIGRFAALPYQRETAKNQIPKQNGTPHEKAGDQCALFIFLYLQFSLCFWNFCLYFLLVLPGCQAERHTATEELATI